MRNVVVLSGIPNRDLITVEEFRTIILEPLLKEIESRGLTTHIQGIAYSSDFPTAVQLDTDLVTIPERSQYLTPVGSINGLTYLFRFLLAKNPGYVGFDTNFYAVHDLGALLNISLGTPEVREGLIRNMKENQFTESAKTLDDLTAIAANPFPLEYLSARQWAFAGEYDQARARLKKAIQHGWRYRKMIDEDKAFDAIRNDEEFIAIVKRCPKDPSPYTPTRGFDARAYYSPNTLGSNRQDQGVSYMLSMVLGVTRDLGITEQEAILQLNRSADADYSRPDGTFVFTRTGDVRTKTREPHFATAIERLQALNMKAKVVDGTLPPLGEVCSGVMIGSADYDWVRSGATLLPGAIAESLTSFGGAMTLKEQTKLTELIRYGAAASSGAVTEPYSVPNKFPTPWMHVQYVEGLTAAEAFYGSVLCPYQLLIVGDPLCQPFAEPPRFSLIGLENGQTIRDRIQFELKTSDEEHAIDPIRMQWIIDGQLKGELPFDPKVNINIEKKERGAHEWRMVARGPNPLDLRYEQSVWIQLGPASETIAITGPSKAVSKTNETISLNIKGTDPSKRYSVRNNWEEIASLAPGETEFTFQPKQVGYGTIRLQLLAEPDANGIVNTSMPFAIELSRPPVN